MIGAIGAARARFLRPGSFVANVATLASWGLVAQGINLLFTPVLTRVYSPHQFGLYALFTNTAVTLAVVAAMRYEYAVVLPQSEDGALDVAWLAIGFAAIVSLIVALIAVTGAGRTIVIALRVPQLAPYLVWLAPTLFILATYSVVTYWAIRRKEYRDLAMSKLVISIAMAASQVAIALAFARPDGGLIAGLVIGQAAGMLCLARWTGFRSRTNTGRAALGDVARRYSHFPKFSAVGSLLDGVSALLPVAILTAAFSPAIGGLYAIADRVMRMPSVLFGSSLTQVFYQKIAENRDDPARCKALMIRTWKRLFLVGLVPMATMFVAGPQIFAFVLGSQWREAGEYAHILSAGLLVHFVAYPTSNGIIAFERLGVMLSWQSVMIAAIAGVFLFARYVLRATPTTVLWVFSASLVVVYGASLLAQWYVLHSAERRKTVAS